MGIDPQEYGDLLYKHIDKQIDNEKGTIAYWTDFEGRTFGKRRWHTNRYQIYPNSMKQTFLSEFKNHENFILYQLETQNTLMRLVVACLYLSKWSKKLVNVYDYCTL